MSKFILNILNLETYEIFNSIRYFYYIDKFIKQKMQFQSKYLFLPRLSIYVGAY